MKLMNSETTNCILSERAELLMECAKLSNKGMEYLCFTNKVSLFENSHLDNIAFDWAVRKSWDGIFVPFLMQVKDELQFYVFIAGDLWWAEDINISPSEIKEDKSFMKMSKVKLKDTAFRMLKICNYMQKMFVQKMIGGKNETRDL